MNWRQRLALWLDPVPERVNREQLELVVKAGRRCAHDLAHAASDVVYSPYPKDERSKFWAERARHWEEVFYPGDDGKNYRSRLHREIARLEQLCRDNGIDPDELPF